MWIEFFNYSLSVTVEIRLNKPMNARTRELKWNERTGYLHSPKASSQKLLVNQKEKI